MATWSYNDDYTCCRKYLEVALEHPSQNLIRKLIEDLSIEIPHISSGSIKMKLQNIKQISIESGLDDDMPIAPLYKYSQQCRLAFAVALKDIESEKSISSPIDIPPQPHFDDDDLINQQVIHKIFGIGKVIRTDNDHIIVDFPLKTCEFLFPDVFETHLKFKDLSLEQKIDEYIHDCRAYIRLLEKEIKRREFFHK